MTEECIGGKEFGVTGINNEAEKTQTKTEVNSTLTLEAINKLKDEIAAMKLADDHGINLDGLDSVDEIQTRLKCHLKLINEGNFKHKMDGQLKELGEQDILKREILSCYIEEVKNIFSECTNSSATKRPELMEDLLKKDGTTDDIRHDCDLRLTSLKEKECVILVSGESSAGKSQCFFSTLFGEEIFPSHMLHKTSFITVIRYKWHKCAKIVYKNGKVESIPNLDKEGLQILQQCAYFCNAEDGTDERGVYKTRKEDNEIAEIQIYLPINMLHSGLVLVDTPGIGENEFLENYLMEYIRSHLILGIIYIIMTENAFVIGEEKLVELMNFIIKSQRSSNDVVKLNPKAALFVCNRWDMVPQESKKAVRENALKQLRKAWPKFDSSNVVFFSTIKPMQKISINEGFISEENVELMYGFKNFVKLSLDHRIKVSYSWLETVLRRTELYLETMFHRLAWDDKRRQKQTKQDLEKLRILNGKADTVIMSLNNIVNVAVEDICNQVRDYLHTIQARTKLTTEWGEREGELLDLNSASGTWSWIKRHIDTAFDDRLTDLLEEWGEQTKFIPSLETKLASIAKSNFYLDESGLTAAEHALKNTSSSLITRVCLKLNYFVEEDLIDSDVPKIHRHRSKLFTTIAMRTKHDETKLKEYRHNPGKVAQIRSEKLLDSIEKHKNDRLETVVKDFLKKSYNYIQRLNNNIPGLVNANMTLLERIENEFLSDQKHRAQYQNMQIRIERIQRVLIYYGKENFSLHHFDETDVKMLVQLPEGESEHISLIRRPSIADLMINISAMQRYGTSKLPHGLWHIVHLGELTKGSVTKYVAVKMYSTNAHVDNMPNEMVKLRCLMHTDMCIADFLGVFYELDTPTPALIYAGKLSSLRTFMDKSYAHAWNRSEENRRPFDMDTTKTLQDVLAGLQHLHSKGLVHMDLTKDSVTVSETGQVKMTGGCLPRKPVLPKSEFERVTPGWEYLAPEVLCGQMYVACADMYAFALLTLEVANSRFKVFSDVPKYSINSFLELPARTHLQPAVQDLDMTPSVIEKILLCLERDMSKRPDSLKMGEVFKEKPNKSKKIFGIRFSVKKK